MRLNQSWWPFKTLTVACLSAIAFSAHAEHGTLELQQLEVLGRAVAPAELGLESDKQEMRLTPGQRNWTALAKVRSPAWKMPGVRLGSQ